MYLKSLKQKALITAVIAAFAQPALASDECNAGDGLNSWSAWCGIDTYLSQQEPTAAGPIQGGGFSGFNTRNFDSEDFGGNIVKEASDWESYAMIYNPAKRSAEMGKVSVTVDDDNRIFTVQATFEDGTNIDFSDQYRGRGPNDLFAEGQSEDGHYVLFMNSDNNRAVAAISDDKQSFPLQELTYGEIHAGDKSGSFEGYFGKLTPVADITQLKNIQAKTNYTIHSTSIRSTGSPLQHKTHTMNVDFGNGSWRMKNFYATSVTNGKITGNKFDSNGSIVFSGNNKNITGVDANSYIKGSFFGPNATRVAGEANITKLHVNPNQNRNHKVIFAGGDIQPN